MSLTYWSMSNKLIYVDNSTIGSVHELFNATSLKMFSEIYDEVIYYTSRSVKKIRFVLYKTKQLMLDISFCLLSIGMIKEATSYHHFFQC
mgnify:CR=1 FL=1